MDPCMKRKLGRRLPGLVSLLMSGRRAFFTTFSGSFPPTAATSEMTTAKFKSILSEVGCRTVLFTSFAYSPKAECEQTHLVETDQTCWLPIILLLKKLISTGDGLSVLRNNHAAIVRRPANELQKLDAQNLLQKCQAGKCG